jgi:hypothetical protein
LPSAVLSGARVSISVRVYGPATGVALERQMRRRWRQIAWMRATPTSGGQTVLGWRAPRGRNQATIRLVALRRAMPVAVGAPQRVLIKAGRFPPAKIAIVGRPSAVVSLPLPGASGFVLLKSVREAGSASLGRVSAKRRLVIGRLAIQPGQVLALGYASNTPDGFLGRVDAVTLLGNGDESLQTEPATLQDAGAQGNLDLSSFGQVGRAASVDRSSQRGASGAAAGSSTFGSGLRKTLECEDGASASLSGNASVGVTPSLHASFSLIHGLTSASFSLTGSASASLTINAHASAGCTLPSIALFSHPLHIATFAGSIGPIPVVVVLQGQLFADATFNGKAELDSDVNAATSITGGIQWKKGTPNGGFSPIFIGPSASFHFDPPSLTASGTATADLEPALQMLLYGVAGPQLRLKTGLDLDANTNASPWWRLSVPVSLDASFTAPSLELESDDLTLYRHTFAVADAGGPFNPSASVNITNPGTQTSTVGSPVRLQMYASDSDGGTLAYGATGLPAGLSIDPATGIIAGTPTTAGASTTTIIVTDRSGPSGFVTFSWTVNQPPAAGWSPKGFAQPSSGSQASLAGVTCVSATDCEAVGSYLTSDVEPLAEKWDGTSWAVQPVPNPPGLTTELNAVTCLSGTFCVAVGANGLTTDVIADVWNGSNWSAAVLPKPSDSPYVSLLAVSCRSTTDCMAAGYYNDQVGNVHPMTELWNGNSWAIQSTPDPTINGSNAFPDSANLQGITCLPSGCIAVGHYDDNPAGIEKTLIETWDGARWSVPSSPNVQGAVQNDLYSVSCSDATACTAVGAATTGSNPPQKVTTLAERWDGTSWIIQKTPDPPTTISDFDGVSCNTSTSCVAVGGGGDDAGGDGYAAQWDGAAWNGEVPPGTFEQGLYGVSCVSPVSCVAVGGDLSEIYS